MSRMEQQGGAASTQPGQLQQLASTGKAQVFQNLGSGTSRQSGGGGAPSFKQNSQGGGSSNQGQLQEFRFLAGQGGGRGSGGKGRRGPSQQNSQGGKNQQDQGASGVHNSNNVDALAGNMGGLSIDGALDRKQKWADPSNGQYDAAVVHDQSGDYDESDSDACY